MRFRSVASLVLVALIAGAIADHADSSASLRRARTPVRVGSAPAPARPFVAGTPLAIACAAPVPVAPGRRRGDSRRTPLRRRSSCSTPSRSCAGRAPIRTRCRPRGSRPCRCAACRRCRSTRRGCCAARRRAARRGSSRCRTSSAALGVACAPVRRSGPREGLVVVAVGDAASGGGGALDDLVRGRAPVAVAPCAGADHSMLSISGVVPNGVPATAPDGTAVRADVKDNGYEFLLPSSVRTSSATSCGPGETGRRTCSRSSPSRRCRRGRARPPPRRRRPSRASRPTGSSPAGRRRSSTSSPSRCRGASRALRLRRQVAAMLVFTRCAALTPFAPGGGVAMPGRPGPAPPVAVAPARPVPPPSAVPARPVGPPATPAPSAPPAQPAPAPAPSARAEPRVASMRWLLPDPSSS
jgi:hypothetical protein